MYITQQETYEAVKDNILNHDDKFLKEFLLTYIQHKNKGLCLLNEYQLTYCDNVLHVSLEKYSDLRLSLVKKLANEILFYRLNKSDVLDVIIDD